MGKRDDNPFLAPKQRPLILGHRGLPHHHQENTLAGLRRAVALGLDGVELDVMLTRDERVVVFHDEEVSRLTDGTGKLAELTWDELSRLRVKRDVYMGTDARGDVVMHYEREERIPLLREVLDEFKGALAMNIELKPSLPSWGERRVGEHAARVVREAGAVDSVIVTSMDFFKLRAAEREYPALHTGYAYDDDSVDYMPSWLAKLPELRGEVGRPGDAERNAQVIVNLLLEADAIGRWTDATVVAAEHSLIDSDTIEKLHARGLAVGSYTFFPLELTGVRRRLTDEEQTETLRRLVAAKVDWIETDDPERARDLLA